MSGCMALVVGWMSEVWWIAVQKIKLAMPVRALTTTTCKAPRYLDSYTLFSLLIMLGSSDGKGFVSAVVRFCRVRILDILLYQKLTSRTAHVCLGLHWLRHHISCPPGFQLV
jgi:hypothetical protein